MEIASKWPQVVFLFSTKTQRWSLSYSQIPHTFLPTVSFWTDRLSDDPLHVSNLEVVFWNELSHQMSAKQCKTDTPITVHSHVPCVCTHSPSWISTPKLRERTVKMCKINGFGVRCNYYAILFAITPQLSMLWKVSSTAIEQWELFQWLIKTLEDTNKCEHILPTP